MTDSAYTGVAQPSDFGSLFNVLSFIGRQVRNEMWTCMIVKVMAVGTSKKTVDIQACVNQVDGAGNPWGHETIAGCPYMYWQGGTNALQIDPAEGDVGLAVFAHSDTSSVIANNGPANPGSARKFDPSDGMYLGALPGLNPAATQCVRMDASGITLTSTIRVTINADVTINGSLTATGDVTGDGTSLHTHVHGGVTTGSGDTGSPV